ncbi:MAG: PIG-L family deacetylase [Gemmataceae bacterium]
MKSDDGQEPLSVLCLMAHPDDAEILAAGTLARLWREQGAKIHIASMAMGDLGSVEHPSAEIARIRHAEGIKAAALLGGSFECLGERDLCVHYNPLVFQQAVALLRKVKADLIITHAPSDYILDHEECSRIARAAAFGAPIPNLLPTVPPLARIPWLYYAEPIEGLNALGREVEPEFFIDISSTIGDKEQMLACHASQRDWLKKHHGMDEYIEAMKRHGAHQGAKCNVAFAEGFVQHKGHAYPQDNLLKRLLGK